MSKIKTYDEINKKIANKECVVVDAEEIIELVNKHGEKKVLEEVDVVTTGTFGPMRSSGIYLNFGHSEPPIKIKKLGFKTKYDLDYGIKEMIEAYEFLDRKECYYNNRVFK